MRIKTIYEVRLRLNYAEMFKPEVSQHPSLEAAATFVRELDPKAKLHERLCTMTGSIEFKYVGDLGAQATLTPGLVEDTSVPGPYKPKVGDTVEGMTHFGETYKVWHKDMFSTTIIHDGAWWHRKDGLKTWVCIYLEA